jgi:hypothetical protein
MRSIQTHAIFTGFRSKVDRSIGFSGVTPELTQEEKALFFELQGLNTTMTITPEEVAGPIYKVTKEVNQKTQSERLYSVLFIYWKQLGGHGDYQDFYRSEMETIINGVKDKLDS